MTATTPWTKETPTECGEYLVEYIGDWFPKGDSNNINHSVVNVVRDDCGRVCVLSGGHIGEISRFKSYKWAKIINAP